MTIDFIPSATIAVSLLLCAGLPVLVVLLSHGPWKVSHPGRRFLVATLAIGVGWALAMCVMSPRWVELLTGGLLLATATLVAFTCWTLIAWGFTLSMLLALARAECPLQEQYWVQRYTGGRPLEALTRDRLGLLVKLGLARVDDGELILNLPRGRWLAQITMLLRQLFGLPK